MIDRDSICEDDNRQDGADRLGDLFRDALPSTVALSEQRSQEIFNLAFNSASRRNRNSTVYRRAVIAVGSLAALGACCSLCLNVHNGVSVVAAVPAQGQLTVGNVMAPTQKAITAVASRRGQYEKIAEMVAQSEHNHVYRHKREVVEPPLPPVPSCYIATFVSAVNVDQQNVNSLASGGKLILVHVVDDAQDEDTGTTDFSQTGCLVASFTSQAEDELNQKPSAFQLTSDGESGNDVLCGVYRLAVRDNSGETLESGLKFSGVSTLD